MGETARDFPRELPSPIGERPGDAALTARRRRRYRQVLARRTGRLAVVVEDCYDPQNATAVVRTCDAFGIHRCHVVTGHNPFRINRRVSQGAHHYLDLRIHSTIEEVYAELRADGFRIAVADCAADVCRGPGELLPELDAGPLAVVFGNEGHGLGAAAREGADLAFALPMLGFAQSLNLSATAAITCFRLREGALAADAPGDLDPVTQIAWYDRWLRRQKSAARLADAVDPRAVVTTDRRGREVESFHADPERR